MVGWAVTFGTAKKYWAWCLLGQDLFAVLIYSSPPICTFKFAWVGNQLSSWFPIASGVHQVCVIAPDSFATSMDWLIEQ